MRTLILEWESGEGSLPPVGSFCDGGEDEVAEGLTVKEVEEDISRGERPLSDKKLASVGESLVVDPNDDLLKKVSPKLVPGRLMPVAPAVEECAYSPGLGSGMNVGVAGREIGVGIELTVAVVLILLRPSVEVDSRDCGLLVPEC